MGAEMIATDSRHAAGRSGLFPSGDAFGDPEFSGLEAGAQRDIVGQKLNEDDIHQRPETQSNGINVDEAHIDIVNGAVRNQQDAAFVGTDVVGQLQQQGNGPASARRRCAGFRVPGKNNVAVRWMDNLNGAVAKLGGGDGLGGKAGNFLQHQGTLES